MSRIGKKPIKIPPQVKIEILGQEIKVSGPLGTLVRKIAPALKAEIKDESVLLSPNTKEYSKRISALWGLHRALVNNMVEGVTKGFEKKLDIEGVGYRVALEGNDLVFGVGFTHPVKIKCPEGIRFSVEKNVITVSGCDREKVGQISAIIRKIKKAEPYKGKGIKYMGEKIRRKEGKKVITAKT